MIFCGLGINNTMMYNQVKKTWAKQSVALDVSHADFSLLMRQSEVKRMQYPINPLPGYLAMEN